MKKQWKNMDSKHVESNIYEVVCPHCGTKRDIYERDPEMAKIVFQRHGKHIRTKSSECSNCGVKFRVIKSQAQYSF